VPFEYHHGKRPAYRGPRAFDPAVFESHIFTWTQKFSYLRSLHHRPVSAPGDTWDAFFTGEGIVIDLQSYLFCDTAQHPPDSTQGFSFDTAVLPAIPEFSRRGVVIRRHTLRIDVDQDYSDFEEGAPNPVAWSDWLYRNSKLDRRIVSIATGSPITTSMKDVVATLTRRMTDKCEPMISLRIDLDDGSTHQSLDAMSGLLGPKLETLEITHPASTYFRLDLAAWINRLDEAFPMLEHLEIYPRGGDVVPSDTIVVGTPLSGMPNLRSFRFAYSPSDPSGVGFDRLVEHLWRLGSPSCRFSYKYFPSERLTTAISNRKEGAA
jgi:hypothetical protein